MPESSSNLPPAPLVALAGWLVPGSGYWLIGQRGRGLTAGVTILILFVLGCFIGGMRVIDPAADYTSPFRAIMQKPWFVAQVLAGPITLISALIAKGPAFVASHARLNEIGTLYTAVAGMLNLLVIIDCSHRAWLGDKQQGGKT